MCIGVPGKVLKVNGDSVTILSPYGRKECGTTMELKEDDYVITFNDLVIKKVSEEEAVMINELLLNPSSSTLINE